MRMRHQLIAFNIAGCCSVVPNEKARMSGRRGFTQDLRTESGPTIVLKKRRKKKEIWWLFPIEKNQYISKEFSSVALDKRFGLVTSYPRTHKRQPGVFGLQLSSEKKGPQMIACSNQAPSQSWHVYEN